MVTPVIRFTSRAQKTSPSLAESISTKKKPKPSAAISARPAPRATPPLAPSSGSSREASTTPADRQHDPASPGARPGRSPGGHPGHHRDHGGGGRDGRDHGHRAHREPAVERRQRAHARPPTTAPATTRWCASGGPSARTATTTRSSSRPTICEITQDREHRDAAAGHAAHEVGDPPGQARGEPEDDGDHGGATGGRSTAATGPAIRTRPPPTVRRSRCRERRRSRDEAGAPAPRGV